MDDIPSPPRSLAEHILDHAERQPNDRALLWRGKPVSYAELADLTQRAYEDLAERAGKGTSPIAIVARKSPRAIATILAGTMVGRPVLLPSAELGVRALELLLERSGCRLVATPTEAAVGWRVIEPARPVRLAADVCFLLTTSGSTGVPKIVPLDTGAVRRFTSWAAAEFGIGPGTNVLNYAPLNFDLCLLDIWATLRAGGCVTLVDPEHAVQPRYLLDLLDSGEPHVVQAVPMFFRILSEAAGGKLSYPGVRHVLLTGDHTPRRLRTSLPGLFPHARFHNLYGCTETNDSFLYSFGAEMAGAAEVLPLGAALPGVTALVMTDDGVLDGPGTGELWVATPFQTAGYLHEGADRFVSRTVDGAPVRYFRSGDLVSRDDQGELTLVGRTDFQVKVRGVRVSIEEIERVIAAHHDVAEVGVVACADAETGQRLHALVRRSSDRLTGLRLRQHCAERLPRPAIPTTIRVVDDPLPTTSTGKVDRNRIRAELPKGDT